MKKVLKVIANKYLITTIGFVIWMLYVDQNDWFTMQQKKRDLKAAQDNITFLKSEVSRMETERNQLQTQPDKLEQFARENFRMKRDNEDLYVIEKSK